MRMGLREASYGAFVLDDARMENFMQLVFVWG